MDADILANVPLTAFYEASTDAERLEAVADLLEYRGVVSPPDSSIATPSDSPAVAIVG